MHGGDEKNEGRDSDELVRKEKRKFVRDNVLDLAGNYPGHKKYEQTDWKCQACNQQVREDQEHVTHCEGYEDLRAEADLMNEEELVQFFTRVMERRQEMNWD